MSARFGNAAQKEPPQLLTQCFQFFFIQFFYVVFLLNLIQNFRHSPSPIRCIQLNIKSYRNAENGSGKHFKRRMP